MRDFIEELSVCRRRLRAAEQTLEHAGLGAVDGVDDVGCGCLVGRIGEERDDGVGVANGECRSDDFDDAFFFGDFVASDAGDGVAADAFGFDVNVDNGVGAQFAGFFHEVGIDDGGSFDIGRRGRGEERRLARRFHRRFVGDDLDGLVVFHGDDGCIIVFGETFLGADGVGHRRFRGTRRRAASRNEGNQGKNANADTKFFQHDGTPNLKS